MLIQLCSLNSLLITHCYGGGCHDNVSLHQPSLHIGSSRHLGPLMPQISHQSRDNLHVPSKKVQQTGYLFYEKWAAISSGSTNHCQCMSPETVCICLVVFRWVKVGQVQYIDFVAHHLNNWLEINILSLHCILEPNWEDLIFLYFLMLKSMACNHRSFTWWDNNPTWLQV